ncbi:hypothetical protein RchiOBHm_Chr4g0407251 [Rosa chinensis]|uniref:Uncharacterized protein n=1 Tax=Rosa chinensis TaxID=74649 RepID=A0A2P6QUM8_ROSCH|nr:hypothetical protein RchiOBHm_Chr4g0407251 [Rosa chinensis]
MRFAFGIMCIRVSKGSSAQVRFLPRIGQFIDAESDRQTHSLQGTPQRCTLFVGIQMWLRSFKSMSECLWKVHSRAQFYLHKNVWWSFFVLRECLVELYSFIIVLHLVSAIKYLIFGSFLASR